MTGDLLIFLQALATRIPEFGPPADPPLHGLTLEIFSGESLVLLDATGAASTALRVLAGLVVAESGVIFTEGRDITALPPHLRGFGVALGEDRLPGPLATIDVVGFPLLARGLLARDRRRMASEMLQQAGLSGLGQVKAAALDAAQTRRAALARGLMRAMLFTQPVLLLDEPLAGLEGEARAALLETLIRVQERFELTMVTALRDADEARRLGQRIAVLGEGRLEQVGPAGLLYAVPETLHAARALGETNLLAGRLEQAERGRAMVRLAGGGVLAARLPLPMRPGDPCLVQVRPEHLALVAAPEEQDGASLPARVRAMSHRGDHVRLELAVGETEIATARLPWHPDAPPPASGARVALSWHASHAAAFPLP